MERLIEGDLSASLIYDEKGNEIASVGIFKDLRERLKNGERTSEDAAGSSPI